MWTHHPTDLAPGLADFLRRAQVAEASFSPNDSVIAAFVRRNPLVVALSTADQLAHHTGVSKAAVVRFAARLGYPGFTELRDDLRQRVIHSRAEPRPAVRDESVDAVRTFLSTKLTSDLASLSSFVETVDRTELLRCAELLVQPSARVLVTGHRRGFAMATLAHRTFSWVRKDVQLWRMEELGVALALDDIGAGDVVLAFAFRRYPRITGVVLEYARSVGATTILVTETLTCPYVELADSILLCPSGGSSALDSSVPAVFCIETLAGLMIQLVGSEVDERIRHLHDARHASSLEDADVPSPPENRMRFTRLERAPRPPRPSDRL
jgi:DNA-binding MurR/RpiR family transcriptional regulator